MIWLWWVEELRRGKAYQFVPKHFKNDVLSSCQFFLEANATEPFLSIVIIFLSPPPFK